MRHWIALLAAGAGLMLMSGCSQPQQRVQSVEVRSARLEDRVSRLERSNDTLQRVVDSLSTLVEEQTREIRDRRADRSQQLTELEALIQALQAEQLRKGEELRGLQDQVRFALNAASDANPLAEAADSTPELPQSHYDNARQDQSRGNYSLAILGYEDLLDRFPKSVLADNARYWIGECYYVQKDYKQALEQFEKVLEDYPGQDKVPDAMYKIGQSYVSLDKTVSAIKAFEALIKAYPNHELSRLAREKIKDLKARSK